MDDDLNFSLDFLPLKYLWNIQGPIDVDDIYIDNDEL